MRGSESKQAARAVRETDSDDAGHDAPITRGPGRLVKYFSTFHMMKEAIGIEGIHDDLPSPLELNVTRVVLVVIALTLAVLIHRNDI